MFKTLSFVLLLLSTAALNAAEQERQATFKNAEDAVAALATALQNSDKDSLLLLFDRQYEGQLTGGDEENAKETLRIVGRAMQTRTELIDDGRNRKVIVVGSENWPVPFSLIREKGMWRFDTEAGIEEAINRRVGRNELNAVSICRAYVDAQIEYASADRDGDEVLEYAQALVSTGGSQDGLFWKAAPGERISPFGPLIADAKGYLSGRDPGDPYRGYYYKVISRQSDNAAGGRYDYVINGNMIAGFGLVAFPADHGNSGVMTFMCNHSGKVFEKDLGPDSDLIAAGIDEYDPDESWKLADD